MNQIKNVQQAETIYCMLNCEWDMAKALMQKLDRMIMGFQKSVRLTDNARYVIAVTIEFEHQYMTEEEKEALKSLGFEKELHEKENDKLEKKVRELTEQIERKQ